MDDLLKEIKQGWLRDDYKYLANLQAQLREFSRLYLRHFDKPLFRDVNLMVLEDIKNEMEALNARLHGNKTTKRRMAYRLGTD